jgi:hypothetical protein
MASQFMTSALDESEWSASHPDLFTIGERAPGTHWIRGWVSHRAGPNAMEETRICSPFWEYISALPGHSPTLYRLNC